MKKHLIAAAVAAAVAVPAMAQNVTVYGVIDFGLDQRKDQGVLSTTTGVATAGESKVSATTVNNIATSRIGFRGTEDLGGGLKANFTMETGVNTGASSIGDRALWAEIAGGFGAVRLGRQDTNQRGLILAYNLPGYINVLGNNMSATAADTGNGLALIDDRYNAIKYFSPVMNGLQFNAAYTKNETDNKDNTKDAGGSGYDLGVTYTAGKLQLGLAYLDQDTKTGTTNDKTKKVTMAGARYDFGPAVLAYMYQDAENKDSVSATADQEVKAQQVSIRVPVGALTLSAGYGTTETSYTTGGEKIDGDGYQLAASYALSKRTSAYAAYGKTDRDAGAGVKVKNSEFAVGVVHSF